MNRFDLLCVTLLVGMNLGCHDIARPPQGQECVEFNHRTHLANGDEGVCRILWCSRFAGNASLGGPATLWCRPEKGAAE